MLKVFTRKATALEVSCESISDSFWTFSTQKTCFMSNVTRIYSYGFKISSAKDEKIAALRFDGNKQVLFLPVGVNEQFPNLAFLRADHCSIRTISKENFKDLKKLKELQLYYNQIETIGTDVFEDLISLEILYLGENLFLFYFYLTVFFVQIETKSK